MVALDDEPIPDGQRNTALASVAGSLRRKGLEETEIYLALLEENQRRCQPPLPEKEVASIAASISRYDPAPPDALGWRRFKWTEYGNAERLVERHGHDLRHSSGFGWLVWDGACWRQDSDGAAVRRMKDTVRAMWAELPEIENGNLQKSFFGFIRSSENERRLASALRLAESEAAVVCGPDELDADPYLLTVANGTLDLRRGDLRPHAREDLIAKCSPVEYRPGARSRLWERFLQTVTGGDQELVGFLQRAAGYSLSGDTGEEKLFFAHGPAATGKSSFLEAVKAVLGDYATTTDFETLLKRKGDRGIPNDIARLAGTRLVLSIEVEDGKQLASGLVKTLTGGDTVVARYLRQEFFEFQPRFKLWLAANERPRVSASDTGIWRRIVQVPFTEAIPEARRDPTVKKRLRNEAEVQQAILAWAVEGCLAWQQDGLRIPERVRDYTEEYRQENDALADFFDECCLFEPDARVSRARLRTVYGHWAQRRFQKPWSAKAFADELKRRGVTDGGKLNGDRAWQGIRLTDKAEASETQWERFDLF